MAGRLDTRSKRTTSRVSGGCSKGTSSASSPRGRRFPSTGHKLLAPVLPSKIVCVGLNYKDHAAEQNKPLPPEPLLFIKPSTSVIGPGEAIVLPEGAGRVDHEAECAVVIGRRATRVSEAEAMNYVLGITCVNDVTARELQNKGAGYTRAKGFDTFAPVGPCIVQGLDYTSAKGLTVEGLGQRREAPGLLDQGADLPDPHADCLHLREHDTSAG